MTTGLPSPSQLLGAGSFDFQDVLVPSTLYNNLLYRVVGTTNNIRKSNILGDLTSVTVSAIMFQKSRGGTGYGSQFTRCGQSQTEMWYGYAS